VHLFVCYLNKLRNARCNDKDSLVHLYFINSPKIVTKNLTPWTTTLLMNLGQSRIPCILRNVTFITVFTRGRAEPDQSINQSINQSFNHSNNNNNNSTSQSKYKTYKNRQQCTVFQLQYRPHRITMNSLSISPYQLYP
jgi:hypothetical protein